ncbi:ArnT family glycosyltransferase [Ktedonobacter racemifer]|uniref:Glycosyl transferase family 39 n=1 Tax=Ktedonobacter racemifer DSM 44963 TaxID=485913 RepID=D6U8J5_KTERA|nr:glycosyltransferase family 39 protein [Ktedonobacter racemifer]EFH80206.1 glycosyl transferase family 39 [Ktedonobacter racemifer DSM 44963]
MAETITTSNQAEPEYPTEQPEPQKDTVVWQRIALGAILLISVFMNFYKLGQIGFDTYYPPAVRSMMDNWHNFFFAAYDPGGFTSLDKPPVGFWLQVLSAKIFGLTPFSVLLPQALCGVLAVLLLYSLVRRQFGATAGLLAALALALSPVSIVTNRNVTIDSTLALVLLVGAWAVLRAAATGRPRWLLLCAAMVGIGFNIKMLEAYLVLPAFGLLYLLAAPTSIWKRLWHLAVALLLLLVISFSWALAVDLTPATLRPHVGSTQENSEIGLALGYNGLQRLLGVGIKGGTATPNNVQSPGSTSGSQAGPGKGKAPAGISITTGNGTWNAPGNAVPAPFHLFTEPLAGQSGWLLPLAIVGMIALVKFRRPRPRSDRTLQALILWGMWLLTMGVFFSVAGFIHEYYLTVMYPALAALCGIGLVTMWQDYRRSGWRAWLLPLALIATAAEQVFILTGYPNWGRWMIPLLIVLCALAVLVLIGARLPLRFTRNERVARLLMPALALGLVALVLGPTLWAAIPIFQGTESDLPLAGPSQNDGPMGGLNPMKKGVVDKGGVDPALIRYLSTHQGNAQILAAVAGMADDIILATNKPVIPLDGFSSYPLTTSELASLVSSGKLRFLLLNEPQDPNQGPQQGQGQTIGKIGGGSAGTHGEDVLTWAKQHCKVVPSSQWQSSSSGPSASSGPQLGSGPNPNDMKLYDCAAAH